VVVKLNGGLGTSMGMTRAKSLLEVKPGLCFLDVIARQVLHLRERHRSRVPLLLMNSFRTQEDSLRALARHPDLATDLPADFLQHKVPRIHAEAFAPIHWPRAPEYEWCPPGHGDLYTALHTSGVLDQLLTHGLEYAFVSNADNLGADLDLALLGWFADSDAPFAMEVCPRAESHRKGGHLARLRDGRLVLRELAQCPEDEVDQFQDVRRYRFFNTNNLWIHLPSLRRVLDDREGVLGLPMIRNEKRVDPMDESSPLVIQIETAMGSAIQAFEGARAIQVAAHRFAPVKSTGDLLAVRSDAYELGDDQRIVPSGGRAEAGLVVRLDDRSFKRIDQLEERFPEGPPSLAECRRLEVEGDVRFEGGVRCHGDVSVLGPKKGQGRVAAGRVLTGRIVLG